PGGITKPRVSLRAIVREPGMIERSVKTEVAHVQSASQGHAERLNSAIKVLVIDRILIMVESANGTRYLVSNEGATIDARGRFNRVDRCSGPRPDGWSHS